MFIYGCIVLILCFIGVITSGFWSDSSAKIGMAMRNLVIGIYILLTLIK